MGRRGQRPSGRRVRVAGHEASLIVSQAHEARQRAERFFALHGGKKPLVLLHAWDAGSARAIEQAGAPALATTCAGIAWSLGCEDGESVLIEDLLDVCQRICQAVSVPVSVDLPDEAAAWTDPCALIAQLIMMGAAGITVSGAHEQAMERLAATRTVVRQLGACLFANVRVDDARFETALDRAQRLAEAGADGVFVPALSGFDVARLARSVSLAVSVDVGDGWGPPIYGLAQAGVRRISVEHGPFRAAAGLVRRIAREALAGHPLHGLVASHGS